MTKPLMFGMAAATGLTVANIHYNQPMLGLMEKGLGGQAATYVPMVTQFGYAAGLLFLVPLGDKFERKGLIVGQCLALAVSLAVLAWAPNAMWVLFASLIVGLLGSVAQQIVPFAANLAPDSSRGTVVGTVMGGLLCGILLSRTLAGFVAGVWGWREMYWLAVPLALGTAAFMGKMLPRSEPTTRDTTYGQLMASLVELWRTFPQLRLAAYTQCCQFGMFTAFWSILTLRLQDPRYDLGPEVAGLFGILGAAGVLASPIAGRYADKKGPHCVIVAMAALSLAAWVIFAAWQSLLGLMIGIIVLDFAIQASQISNQSIIYALRPHARSRINTVYITMMFLSGATFSGISTAVWHAWGWNGVTLLGGSLGVLCLLLQIKRRRYF